MEKLVEVIAKLSREIGHKEEAAKISSILRN